MRIQEFSVNGDFVVTVDEGEFNQKLFRVWNVITGQEISFRGMFITLIPNTQAVLSCHESTFYVTDFVSGEEIASFAAAEMPRQSHDLEELPNPLCGDGVRVQFAQSGSTAFITSHTPQCANCQIGRDAIKPIRPVTSTVLTTTNTIRQD